MKKKAPKETPPETRGRSTRPVQDPGTPPTKKGSGSRRRKSGKKADLLAPDAGTPPKKGSRSKGAVPWEEGDDDESGVERTYTIGFGGRCGISERVVGTIPLETVVEALVSGEEWEEFIRDKFFDFDDEGHEYAAAGTVDTLEEPDGTRRPIDIPYAPPHPEPPSFTEFGHVSETDEGVRGGWQGYRLYSIELSEPFDPARVRPNYEGPLVTGYSYEMDGHEEEFVEDGSGFESEGNGFYSVLYFRDAPFDLNECRECLEARGVRLDDDEAVTAALEPLLERMAHQEVIAAALRDWPGMSGGLVAGQIVRVAEQTRLGNLPANETGDVPPTSADLVGHVAAINVGARLAKVYLQRTAQWVEEAVVEVGVWVDPRLGLEAVVTMAAKEVRMTTDLLRGKLWAFKIGLPDSHDDSVKGAFLLPDGAGLSWSNDCTLRVWDLATGACRRTLEGHEDVIRGALLLPDGAVLSWSGDRTLRVWDLATGACRRTLEGHEDVVLEASLLPDGAVLSWSYDGTLRVWDLATGTCRRTLEGHESWVNGALLLPDGAGLSWSNDCTLRVWDLTTGACRRTLEGHEGGVCGALLLPDGAVLSWSGDGTLRVWDLATGACRRTLEGHEDVVHGALLLPDGAGLSWSNDCTLRVWDLATGACRRTLEGHEDVVRGAFLLPDGAVLSWSEDHTLRVWDLTTGACRRTLEGHEGEVWGASLLPDGAVLSWSYDGTLRVWDLATGTCRRALEGQESWVNGVLLLPDGAVLSLSEDHTLRVWDPEDERISLCLGVVSQEDTEDAEEDEEEEEEEEEEDNNDE